MTTGLVIAALVILGIYFYLRVFSPQPDFPPLETSPDDPLMLEALEKARASLPEFLRLARQPAQSIIVKLQFVSNSGEVEHLWAEVLEVISNTEFDIRLVTPPVTHSGHLDRRYVCKIDDIEDWQVIDAEGKIHGAFTQRAMFAIARRDGIPLPKNLLAHEKDYAPD